MILDANYLLDGTVSTTTFSVSGSAVTGFTAGGVSSTNVIDLVNARDMGIGDAPALKVMVLVTAAFTTTGTASTTMAINVQGAPTNTAGAAWVTYAGFPAYASASLTAGTKFQMDVPPVNPDSGPLPRYLRLQYVLGGPGSTFSAGSVVSTIVLGADRFPGQAGSAYPSGITISN